jgi:molybdopterin/thiamine biosynthesis adenylyltransferase
LARQYGVINELVLDIPDIPVLEDIFPDSLSIDEGLCSRLVSHAKAVAGPEITVLPADVHHREVSSSCSVYIGSFDPMASPVFCVTAVAEGWRFDCSTKRRTYPVVGQDSNPLGPYMAACFAASAVFKYFWQLDAQTDVSATLWGCIAGRWKDLAVGISPSQMTLPPTYLIGCGAVGAAFAFSLAATADVKGDIVAIDPQKSDETNRNRLLTMSYDDIEEKAILVKRLFAGKGVNVYPYVGRWPEYTADPSRQTPLYLREVEQQYRYDWVLSCVDRNHHRRAIAAYLPKTVFGGSTHDFAAQVAIYSMRGDCECLACNHPVPKIMPTEDLRELLLSFTSEELNTWFGKHDVDLRERSAIEEYLWDPNCGNVGQALLAKLGRDGETDWAVGFVSVAAGVLLASTVVRSVLQGTAETIVGGSEFFAWFLRPGLGRSCSFRKTVCELCTSEDKQQLYSTLWGIENP